MYDLNSNYALNFNCNFAIPKFNSQHRFLHRRKIVNDCIYFIALVHSCALIMLDSYNKYLHFHSFVHNITDNITNSRKLYNTKFCTTEFRIILKSVRN